MSAVGSKAYDSNIVSALIGIFVTERALDRRLVNSSPNVCRALRRFSPAQKNLKKLSDLKGLFLFCRGHIYRITGQAR